MSLLASLSLFKDEKYSSTSKISTLSYTEWILEKVPLSGATPKGTNVKHLSLSVLRKWEFITRGAPKIKVTDLNT